MKKLIAGIASAAAIISATAIPSFAATVDLPPEFASIAPIFEIVLRIAEFLSKIISFFN
ncbi:MAG: hypothetical protein IIW48_04455 [Clostridia bacterium]|nr:hypothetical protein [Clostridia bacterium]